MRWCIDINVGHARQSVRIKWNKWRRSRRPQYDYYYRDSICVIKDLWAKVSSDKEAMNRTAIMMYNHLFSKHPEYKQLFSGDLQKQASMLMDMICYVVDHLNDLDALYSGVVSLGKRHVKYGVPAHSYAHVLEAFTWAMKYSDFRESFTPRASYAFQQLILWVAGIMVEQGEPKPLETGESYSHEDFRMLDRFETFLLHKTCLSYFQIFLASQLSQENCLFYEEVKRFKAITNVPTMLGTATDIKAQFIDRNGATPINVSGKLLKRVTFDFEKGNISHELYDTCVEEVVKLLENDKWHLFLNSKVCKSLMNELTKEGK